MRKIILASTSPRRKELMESLGLPFEVMASNADESINPDKPLREEIENLSFRKALAVFKDHKDAIVIGSDTIVTLDEKILGKPLTKEKAKAMLKMISGRSHEVITAVSIITAQGSETFSSRSIVQFYEMSDEEIDEYVKSEEPLDKAGAYAIQGLGAKYIKGIIGDYYAIMGLPIGEVYHRIIKYL